MGSRRVIATWDRFALVSLTVPWRPVRHGVMVALVVYVLWMVVAFPYAGRDAYAYWAARAPGFYDTAAIGGDGAYLYSPAFAQLLAPFQPLPWEAFRMAWAALSAGSLIALLGPFAALALVAIPVHQELIALNVHLPLALAVVAGFRWPATWAFVLLTKVTPGVGLLWFAVRREWRSLGIALGVTAVIVTVSFVLDPGAWAEWVAVLAGGSSGMADYAVPVPFLPRLVGAVLLVTWGARTGRRWTVPAAAMLAMPVLWMAGLSMLAGSVALWMRDRHSA